MKVLFMTNIPSPYRVDFFNELGKRCELTVIFESNSATDRDSKWMSSRAMNFTPVFLKGIRMGVAEAFCPGVIRYLSKKKFDVIIVGMYSSPTGMFAISFMRMAKIPFILSTDGGMIKEASGIKYKFKRFFINSATAWLSTGKATTEYLEYYGANPDKTYVYPFTSVSENDVLSAPMSVCEKKQYKNKLGIIENKMILSVGQFIYRKGYDVLLEACKNVDKNIGIYIVGGKPTEEYLAIKQEYNLTNVHFLEFMKKDELSEYYKASDLFILPTREDIWGLVINEAMAYGLPVITTDKCVAGLEMITNGENGFIVPADDPDALCDKIMYNGELNIEKTLETARKYTLEKMAERHFEILECVGGNNAK